MKKKQILLIVVLFGLFTIGCKKSEEIKSKNYLSKETTEIKIPYADESILRNLKQNNLYVDYELSRKAAFFDLASFKDVFSRLNPKGMLTLSEKPVIIYDLENTPKFYEFIVLDSTKRPIATITSFAQKEVMDFTACVLPFVRSYESSYSLKYTSKYPSTDEIEAKQIHVRNSNL